MSVSIWYMLKMSWQRKKLTFETLEKQNKPISVVWFIHVSEMILPYFSPQNLGIWVRPCAAWTCFWMWSPQTCDSFTKASPRRHHVAPSRDDFLDNDVNEKTTCLSKFMYNIYIYVCMYVCNVLIYAVNISKEPCVFGASNLAPVDFSACIPTTSQPLHRSTSLGSLAQANKVFSCSSCWGDDLYGGQRIIR